MKALIGPAERLALALWAGLLWTLGYLVTPALFRVLEDPEQAARIAAELHQVGAWAGLACGAVLIAGQLRFRIRPFAAHWRLCMVVAMVVLTAIGEFALRPGPEEIELVRDGGEAGVWDAGTRVAETLYFINGIIALVLVVGGINPPASSPRASD